MQVAREIPWWRRGERKGSEGNFERIKNLSSAS